METTKRTARNAREPNAKTPYPSSLRHFFNNSYQQSKPLGNRYNNRKISKSCNHKKFQSE